ncbi:beta-ketoacyl synthase N-terminal-like domain-containing protein [Asanoa sp. WMMD1127]|uniref:beta-ketoacyl synthase N-terminal-like domain-containing protein n=1 Tax=Asanoa sp. WMMD1127 TaxID=3016107 RepID=UPI00241698A3|nr:beta-ketoacyl synthase N-terminal-like domain-containing protein [Asanoa sp. WMMD1127]MDG4826235.1 beta-ketoacyl synthase N-terminal-like domain-containing protein [Asanoa sp. WMMD1127]
MMRSATDARDVVVTGMGFCLPGIGRATITTDDVWEIVSTGKTAITSRDDGVFYGSVDLPAEKFAEYFPEIPGIFAAHFTDTHRFGLMSFLEACTDAKLDVRAGALTNAGILVGRGGVDTNIAGYLKVLNTEIGDLNILEATSLFIESSIAVTSSDVALAQSAFARTTGPCYTANAGCSSSSVQINNARLLINSGASDVIAVTGVDNFYYPLLKKVFDLVKMVQDQDADSRPTNALPDEPIEFDRLMRPYDRRQGCVNYGEGSVTLILESREHAERRGAAIYGQVLNQAVTRDGLPHPLASDQTGAGLVAAVRQALGDRPIESVGYVHGGSDGGMAVQEAEAIRTLFGDRAGDLLMTSQEGCFGHNGAPTGALGVALTLLMMRNRAVCPTANCVEPLDFLPFNPLPGHETAPLAFDHALSFTYQLGGVQSAILLGSPDAL